MAGKAMKSSGSLNYFGGIPRKTWSHFSCCHFFSRANMGPVFCIFVGGSHACCPCFSLFSHDHCSTILTSPGRGVRLTWTEEKTEDDLSRASRVFEGSIFRCCLMCSGHVVVLILSSSLSNGPYFVLGGLFLPLDVFCLSWWTYVSR